MSGPSEFISICVPLHWVSGTRLLDLCSYTILFLHLYMYEIITICGAGAIHLCSRPHTWKKKSLLFDLVIFVQVVFTFPILQPPTEPFHSLALPSSPIPHCGLLLVYFILCISVKLYYGFFFSVMFMNVYIRTYISNAWL